jgi:hypothetical protein
VLAKASIAMLNELTESEVTELTSFTVDETSFVILQWHGRQGNTIVCSLRKVIFDIQVNQY